MRLRRPDRKWLPDVLFLQEQIKDIIIIFSNEEAPGPLSSRPAAGTHSLSPHPQGGYADSDSPPGTTVANSEEFGITHFDSVNFVPTTNNSILISDFHISIESCFLTFSETCTVQKLTESKFVNCDSKSQVCGGISCMVLQRPPARRRSASPNPFRSSSSPVSRSPSVVPINLTFSPSPSFSEAPSVVPIARMSLHEILVW